MFEALGARVLAVNPASIETHAKWSELLGLRFPILSDQKLAMARAYGAKTPLLPLVRRTVYAIGTDGSIVFAERGMASLKRVMEAIQADAGRTGQ